MTSDELLEPCANEGGTFREPARERGFESTLRKVQQQRHAEEVVDAWCYAGASLAVLAIVGLIVKIIFA
jgi:hypothetical protein